MSGLIEFCVELRSASEGAGDGAAAAESDGDVSPSHQAAAQDGGGAPKGRGRRGKLQRQNSVVCSRVHSLNTISYVDNGESRRIEWNQVYISSAS